MKKINYLLILAILTSGIHASLSRHKQSENELIRDKLEICRKQIEKSARYRDLCYWNLFTSSLLCGVIMLEHADNLNKNCLYLALGTLSTVVYTGVSISKTYKNDKLFKQYYDALQKKLDSMKRLQKFESMVSQESCEQWELESKKNYDEWKRELKKEHDEPKLELKKQFDELMLKLKKHYDNLMAKYK